MEIKDIIIIIFGILNIGLSLYILKDEIVKFKKPKNKFWNTNNNASYQS